MRKILLLAIAAIATLSACKKNTESTPANKTGAESEIVIARESYPTVQIGSQSWTALNYAGPGGVYNTGIAGMGTRFGKLYTPLEASQIVLPAGWRIPTYGDYLNLLIARGATKNDDGSYSAGVPVAQSLMAETGWSEGGGNNYSKFNALATGFYHLNNFYGTGNGASFLHSLIKGTPPDQGFMIGPGPNGQPLIFLGIYLNDDDACSVRFVKDN